MLIFAISAFFALSLIGAMVVIGTTILGYRKRIAEVVSCGLAIPEFGSAVVPEPYLHRVIKPRQMLSQHRSLQPAPLRAAA